jgi:hypothetical protein
VKIQKSTIAALGLLALTSVVPAFGQAGNIPGRSENPHGARPENPPGKK